jgi:uncharacterized membrane protein
LCRFICRTTWSEPDRQIAEGRASSKADLLAEAARLYADHLDAQDELAKMAERADADVAAGRFVVIGRMSQLLT